MTETTASHVSTPIVIRSVQVDLVRPLRHHFVVIEASALIEA